MPCFVRDRGQRKIRPDAGDSHGAEECLFAVADFQFKILGVVSSFANKNGPTESMVGCAW